MDKKKLVNELGEILPLDQDSLTQMIEYALSLPSHSAITDYWLGLLGESSAALDFITNFTKKEEPKPHRYIPTHEVKSTHSKPPTSISNNRNVKNPWNQAVPEKTSISNKPRLSQNVSTTTSQLLQQKPEKPQSKQSQKREKQRKVNNLKDLDEILKKLDLEDNNENVKCDCMAKIHPLFEIVPNCLNCGKIICAKEGLRPCSFCGKELIDPEEKRQIIQLLEAEKQSLETSKESDKAAETGKSKKKKFTISSGAGVDLWKQQEALFDRLDKQDSTKLIQQKRKEEETKQLEEQNKELQFYETKKGIDPDLLKAKENLENLLNFQSNSAERTKIIDQASDFELPTGSNLNIWSNGVEKALQLKKQQRQLRKQEKKQKELTGRGKRVLDITIGKDGKAIMHEVQASEADYSDDDGEIEDDIKNLEKDISISKNAKVEEDLKTIWDYGKDSQKWSKPTYVGVSSEDTHADSTYPLPVENGWDRIQLRSGGSSDNLEDLVTVI